VLREEFGVPFTFYDAGSGSRVYQLDPESGASARFHLDGEAVQALAAHGRAQVVAAGPGRYRLSLLLYAQQKPILVAVAETDALITGSGSAREQKMLEGWLQAVSDRLRLADQLLSRRRAEESQTSQTTVAWEALLVLDDLARRLRVHKDLGRNQQRILESAACLLPACALYWVPAQPDQPVLAQGEGCLAPDEARRLAAALAQSPDFRPPAPLLCNEFQATRWGARYPEVESLVAFALMDQEPLGWLLAVNKKDGAPFRRSEAALLLPFAALAELHLRWSARYQDLKDLLVGLTRSLTTALDAKDAYTYGHSERVARIAVELSRELGLDGDALGDVYLAGLLHDVGKIGVRDTVLQKPGALTPEELEHIQQHVTIGYSILADLRQIRSLLPGVLYHHERIDGSGYPDGLTGEEIPLLARVLAVADAYDAMSHPRPYRDALPVRDVEEILRKGAGTQWDRRVVEAFFQSRQRIHAIRQRGVGDSLRQAIDGALRSDNVSVGGPAEHARHASLLASQRLGAVP
jgi:HD-GYP domain-containing protein (c-di-GMP phosphodiesterase class II)